MGLLDGKVAVVTGAGGGIGREHALAFAREGAKVVVNDLGSSREGSGTSEKFADRVTREIEELGGEAAANYESVATAEGAASILQTALDAFGRVDILVNNAGILRDKTLLKLTDENWDLVIDVHLRGTFLCSREVGRWMKENGTPGRIINTTSYAGLMGNFGQSNYGAAKAGIYGLTKVNSLELAKYGITVNAIAPMAKTRMTEDIAAVSEAYGPEQISPMVVFLASELAADINGRIFGIHGQHLFEYKMVMTEGVEKESDDLWTPSEIQERLEAIGRMHEPESSDEAIRTPAGIIDVAFRQMNEVFRPEKAGDWSARILFDIEDAGPYAVCIDEGTCRVETKRIEDATCVVTVDASTYADVLQGKLSPEKAFMDGKIKATNLGDLMKFAQAFDMRRGKKLLEEKLAAGAGGKGSGAASPASPEAVIEKAFSRLPEIFVPEKAEGWEARIFFDIDGAHPYTVTVEEGTCQVEQSEAEDPTCVVSVAADVYAEILKGKLSPEQAFMEGRIKATNLGDMMKFAGAFDMKKGRELARQEMDRDTSSTEAPPTEGLNRNKLGTKYRGEPSFVRPEESISYARATNDPNPWYVDESREGGIVAPPLFAVRLMKDTLTQLFTDPELNVNMLRLVHGEQSLKFERLFRPWDLVAIRTEITEIEQKTTGEILKARTRWLVDGNPVCEGVSSFFIRSEESGKKKQKKKKVETDRPEEDEILFTEPMEVTEDQPIRYGHASGDTNPIHMDDAVAKQAGLPGKILQGLCTMAFASRAIVQNLLEGDPRGLRELSVRFSHPVFPGDELRTVGWSIEEKDGERQVGFELENQDGDLVIRNGRAVVVEPA